MLVFLYFFIFFLPFFTKGIEASTPGQETLIGIKGKDFVLLGADSSLSSSITLTSSNVDKITLISCPFPFSRRNVNHRNIQHVIAVATSGDSADSERLVDKLSTHVIQIEYESGLGSDVKYLFHGLDDDNNQKGDFSRDSRYSAKYFRTPGSGIDANSISSFARGEIASALRTRNRLKVCLLIGGLVVLSDENHEDFTDLSQSSLNVQQQIEVVSQGIMRSETGVSPQVESKGVKNEVSCPAIVPTLFWLDEYGSIQNVEYGAHGLGSNFILSILDRHYRKNLSRDDALQLIKKCFIQLGQRYVINNPGKPCIKLIDKNGCEIVTTFE